MALNELQTRAYQLIEQDPEAYRILQQQLHRIDPEGKQIPKTALPDVQFEQKVEEHTKPLQEKVEKLESELRKKLEYDENLMQREFMKRNYHMSDAAIDDLAKWMKEDGDGNIYKSYEAAHQYRIRMQQPIIPNGTVSPQKINPMTGHGVREEPWREEIAKRRKESANPRTQDRMKAREEWQKTITELRNRGR
jgi:hypothetical protein